jgi:hypothetical protein
VAASAVDASDGGRDARGEKGGGSESARASGLRKPAAPRRHQLQGTGHGPGEPALCFR